MEVSVTESQQNTDEIRPLRLQQIPLVVAIMNELVKQGMETITAKDYSAVMATIVNAADDIKRNIDGLHISRQ